MLHNKLLGNYIFRKHLERDESIVYIGHKHYVLLLKSFVPYLFLGILLPWMIYVSKGDFQFFWIPLAFCSFVRFYIKFFMWFFDCWIITNKSIIDIYWKSLFKRTIIRIPFAHIEAISISISGFLNTILKRGKIQIVKNSDGNEVILDNAYDPVKIETWILEEQDRIATEIAASKTGKEDKIKTILSNIIEEYARAKNIDLD